MSQHFYFYPSLFDHKYLNFHCRRRCLNFCHYSLLWVVGEQSAALTLNPEITPQKQNLVIWSLFAVVCDPSHSHTELITLCGEREKERTDIVTSSSCRCRFKTERDTSRDASARSLTGWFYALKKLNPSKYANASQIILIIKDQCIHLKVNESYQSSLGQQEV